MALKPQKFGFSRKENLQVSSAKCQLKVRDTENLILFVSEGENMSECKAVQRVKKRKRVGND